MIPIPCKVFSFIQAAAAGHRMADQPPSPSHQKGSMKSAFSTLETVRCRQYVGDPNPRLLCISTSECMLAHAFAWSKTIKNIHKSLYLREIHIIIIYKTLYLNFGTNFLPLKFSNVNCSLHFTPLATCVDLGSGVV